MHLTVKKVVNALDVIRKHFIVYLVYILKVFRGIITDRVHALLYPSQITVKVCLHIVAFEHQKLIKVLSGTGLDIRYPKNAYRCYAKKHSKGYQQY